MASTAKPFEPQTLVDGIFAFQDGMNSGVAPIILAKTQLAFATNATVRGTFIKPRSPFQKITFSKDPAVDFEGSLWQGGCYYKPDSGGESLVAQIGGRLYKFLIGATSATVTDETVPGTTVGAAGPNPVTQPQAWLWQSEKWAIVQDGLSAAVFFDQTASPTSRRSNYGTPVLYNTTVNDAGKITPAVGASLASLTVTDATNIAINDVITIYGIGKLLVQAVAGNVLTLYNRGGSPAGKTIYNGNQVTWQHVGSELPPGRLGTYGLGRNWESLVDGKQFLASDLVGGSSGTVANNFRDAVLNITENEYLSGGGNFTVPGNVGDIKAMRFATTLDKSLGQGALQVFTPSTVFSCDAPTDRSTWQTVTNPIVTESLIGNGGLGQHSTIGWNGDTIFRSIDGMRSLVLARRDFDTWGNVPISREMERILLSDDRTLLAYGSAVTFDNRLLLTATPKANAQGVYHQSLIALNADPTSSLRGKANSVYDGAWTGLNILQLIVGQFSGVERCFAFSLNVTTSKIELYEILPTPPEYTDPTFQAAPKFDKGSVPILWTGETAVLLREQKGKGQFDLCRLIDGELSVDSVVGRVDIAVYYKPDSYPCWIPWRNWTVCAKAPDPTDSTTANYQAGFYPRMGIGEPDPKACDSFTGRNFREAYFFELKFVIRGYCRIIGCKVKAVTLPQPEFAKPVCDNPC